MSEDYSVDRALENLQDIYLEFSEFIQLQGKASEADTRAKVIDQILGKVLFWNEKSIERETHSSGMYIDYGLQIANRKLIVIEAKKSGVTFSLPKQQGIKQVKLKTLVTGENDVADAVMQVRSYCDEFGIRYAIATNGYSWIIFRALRDDIAWKAGYATLFYSNTDIINRFSEFWNLLSAESVTAGSLDVAFSSAKNTRGTQYRLLDRVNGKDIQLERNRLHAQLEGFINTLFRNIADQEYLQILKSCYVYSKPLQETYSTLKRAIYNAIPQFIKAEGGVNVYSGETDSGVFQNKMHQAIENQQGILYLILGGIGCGKTTFLKRYFRLTDKKMLDENAVFFYVSFLGPPNDPSTIELFIWEQVYNQFKKEYEGDNNIVKENRRNIKRIFKDKIDIIHETTLKTEQLDSNSYERRLSPYLEKWREDVTDYVPRLLKLCEQRGKAVIICIDNVDQLTPELQGSLFLVAQRITRQIDSITILALREETYHSARVQKFFNAYSNQKFHISPPLLAKLITKRLSYAKKVLELSDQDINLLLKSGINLDKDAILDFFRIIETSVFQSNKYIIQFIEALSFGNMRLALDMFSIFLVSGVTNVDKMLQIYRTSGRYQVAFHEFAKSIMLEDRKYYKESSSKVMNVYHCSNHKSGSHFTAIRLLTYLKNRLNHQSSEGQGYIDISTTMTYFEEIFNNLQDLVYTCDRLLRSNLIEVNTRQTDTIQTSSHMRLTGAGNYYLTFLSSQFVYLDNVLYDTPISDISVVRELHNLHKKVVSLGDYDSSKSEKMKTRFSMVDLFLKYLLDEEKKEIQNNPLIQQYEDFKDLMLPVISIKYTNQKEYISQKLQI